MIYRYLLYACIMGAYLTFLCVDPKILLMPKKIRDLLEWGLKFWRQGPKVLIMTTTIET